jgi:hypothetical protein
MWRHTHTTCELLFDIIRAANNWAFALLINFRSVCFKVGVWNLNLINGVFVVVCAGAGELMLIFGWMMLATSILRWFEGFSWFVRHFKLVYHGLSCFINF